MMEHVRTTPVGAAVKVMADEEKPFPFVVRSDAMEPTLRAWRDVALVLPSNLIAYDGIYLMRVDATERDLFRVQRMGGRVRINHDNPAYPTVVEVSLDDFNSHLVGLVVGRVEVFDSRIYSALTKSLTV